MDGISSTVDLAATNWTLPRSANNAAIPENATFREVLQGATSEKDSPEKITGVAKQFEALMVGQILKTARESSGGGWLSEEDGQEDQTGSMVMELAEQGFSQGIATRGGLGIAKMVTAQLERGQPKTPSSDSASPVPASPAPAPKHTETKSAETTHWKR
jgi:Rod binding domain-containing protein